MLLKEFRKQLREMKNLSKEIEEDIELGTKNLIALTGAADGVAGYRTILN